MARVRPVAGQLYTIVKGDTLWDIASVVYGSGFKYKIIWDANKSNLRSNDPHWIYPGEQLWIPNDPDKSPRAIDLRDTGENPSNKDEPLAIYITGKQYYPVKASIIRTYDTCSDGWTATFRDDINDEDWIPRRKVFRPYAFPPAEVFIGGTSTGESIIYNVNISGNSSKGEITAEGFNRSIDIVDSVPEPPYQAEKITLENWTKQLIRPFGLTWSTSEVDQDAWRAANRRKIKRIKIGKEEKVFAHLIEKYREKGFVLSNSNSANVVVRSVPDVPPRDMVVEEFVDDAEEGAVPMWEFKSGFSGRDRYRVTVAIGKGRLKHFRDNYVDPAVPLNRRMLIALSSSEQGDMSTAAKSRARKTIEQALTFTVPVRGWYSRGGKLFQPGQFVLYKSKRLFLDRGIVLMIRKVTYVQEAAQREAHLELVPPTVYSKTEEVSDPWISV